MPKPFSIQSKFFDTSEMISKILEIDRSQGSVEATDLANALRLKGEIRSSASVALARLASHGYLEVLTPEKKKHIKYKVKDAEGLIKIAASMPAGRNGTEAAGSMGGYFAQLQEAVKEVAAAHDRQGQALKKLMTLLR